MSSTLAPDVVYRAWQPLGETVSEFRTECAVFEREIDSLLGDLERLRSELLAKARELGAERRRVTEREEQLERQRLETGRFAQRFEFQEAELAATRRELEELRAELSGRKDISISTSSDDTGRVAALESERAALEVELELIRARAAELDETVERQQQQLDTQNREMAEQLSQVKRLIESRADFRLSTSGPVPAAAPSEETPAKSGPPPQAPDPVVSSVMAQFAKLQKDVSRRRKGA